MKRGLPGYEILIFQGLILLFTVRTLAKRTAKLAINPDTFFDFKYEWILESRGS